MTNFFKNITKSLTKSFTKLSKLDLLANLGNILKHPVTIITLLGLVVLLAVFLRAKKIKFTPRLMTQIAIVLAMAAVLDFLKIYKMPQGGSVTLGSMVPLILISLWYGPEVGLLTGALFGVINLILGPTIVHPVQVLFDYPLAFMALGTAGFFKGNKYLGTIVAVGLRFLCHVISGFVFFAEYAGDQNPIIYSIIYNGSYILIDLAICVAILAALQVDRLYKVVVRPSN